MLIYLIGQVPVGTLPCGMKLGFLEMESLKSHNQFLLDLGINSDNHNSLMVMDGTMHALDHTDLQTLTPPI